QEKEGWRERLFVRALPVPGQMPRLTKRQQEVWNIIEEWRAIALQELVNLTGSTTETVRRLEDNGLVTISPQISERDPYAHEHILPTQPLALNPEQRAALGQIKAAMESTRGKAGKWEGGKVGEEKPGIAASPGERPSSSPAVFLLHGVTGSGKT